MKLVGMGDHRMTGGETSVLKEKKFRCNLDLQCNWGGDSSLCCISCPKFENCEYACPYAKQWFEKGIRCPDAVEVVE